MNRLTKFLIVLILILFIVLIYQTTYILKINKEHKISQNNQSWRNAQKPFSRWRRNRLFDLNLRDELGQWDPHKELEQFRRGLNSFFYDDFYNKLFEDSFSHFGKVLTQPEINIEEKYKEYIVTAIIPGLEKDNVKVEVDNNVLTISGSYKTKEQVGTFLKSFPLPGPVKVDKVTTQYKDGVLTIKLPKKNPLKLKKEEAELI